MARGKNNSAASVDRPGQTDPTAPLDGVDLLAAARPVLALLRDDLGKCAEDLRVERALRERYEGEKKARRTADGFDEWREAQLAQLAASWFLSCVFVRTLEDRGLLGQVRLAGPGSADSQLLFLQLAPSLTERDYLLFVFRELAELPAAKGLFDREHALVWQLSPSADAARDLLRLFRTPSAEAPAFRFGQASTRFLADLYQDLYEDVRKRYALLQTPDFIESFILDRTLEPAIARFGVDDTTIIDPTCGSGHFLLGAFERLFEHRLRAQPDVDVRQAAYEALDAVFGADINPYAVVIARVRLILSYLQKAGIRRLKDAPALPLHLVVADSLLHNPQHVQLDLENNAGQSTEGWRAEPFQLEDEVGVRDVLHRRYAAVVGNPPSITEKDRAKRETYRTMYPRSAAGKFALSAPFCERFFQLARERGSVGQIIGNSFMKREFGKRLVEEFLPSVNLELIVNTSGAYIPGHGTPTVLLFGTHERPTQHEVRTVLAKNGEPSTPTDPSMGAVWSSIREHWSDLGFDNDYITVANTDRDKLASHPWNLDGGDTVELKKLLEARAEIQLGDIATTIGVMAISGTDEVYVADQPETFTRRGIDAAAVRPLVVGGNVRDWTSHSLSILYPHNDDGSFRPLPSAERYLWRYRTVLRNVVFFGKIKQARGLNWRELAVVFRETLSTPSTISFAAVATHNQFAFDAGGKVFKQTAPVIKLPITATEDDHYGLLAYLNSSTACFWMKQVAGSKASGDPSRGSTDEAWESWFQFERTMVSAIPIPSGVATLAPLGRELSELAAELAVHAQAGATDANVDGFLRMVALQENIDWRVYCLFELLPKATVQQVLASEFVRLNVGSRPFEILLARSLRDGQPTSWFARNAYPPPATPSPPALIRLAAIIDNSALSVIENPAFKRRWATPDYVALSSSADGDWLLAQLERAVSTVDVHCLRSLASACGVTASPELLDAVRSAAVPFVAAQRFTDTGMAKFCSWTATWEAQRLEDAGGGGAAPPAPLPPRYSAGDYVSAAIWQLRGRLDVPNERFISYPGCESDDGEPVYGWAGWNDLQRAQALASLYRRRKTDEGWPAERLTPVLAGLLELLPWIRQWHDEPDAEFGGLKMGDYFEQFIDGECEILGLTRPDLESWRPTKQAANRPAATAAAAPSIAGQEPARNIMPLKSFEVGNYRAFVEPARIELKELTLLFGYNNAGKSALARVLPLLRDSAMGRRGLPLNLESASVRGGEFVDLRSRQTGLRKIDLTLEWDADECRNVRLVLQDLPERRQHVIESFEIETTTGSRLRGEWVASGEAIGPTVYSVRRNDGPEARVVIDWLGLIPRVHPGLSPEDGRLIQTLASVSEGLQDTFWVGAVRSMQPRTSKFPRLKPDTIAPDGLGAADVLAWDKRYGGELFASVSGWYTANARAPLDVVIRADEYALVTGMNQVSLSDTGEGLTQVLPVLVAGAMAAQVAQSKPSYLVIEQPELHLHPAAHAALAKFFCDIAAAPKSPRIIVETHSENFLFGVQLAIARGQLDPARVLINWIRQDDQNLATVTPIRMDADGRPDAWPKDVFTEEAELARELLEARRQRRTP